MPVLEGDLKEASAVTCLTREECKAKAAAMFATVRMLGSLGLHAEAQAVQTSANMYWMCSLGRVSR